ncbi:Sec-independent protein translocase protein TatA [Lentimicrobium saccharophilum]|uniref:Sec-independent protein translocase protein TatA n=1 Tax=Lentimicrobium saccharophilum TaxID=1678841 RepID=A0A0S7BVC3_9BACT|nr:twin-arginine translocase TatA/TatE family subunit [Lentimicrobium saccharophilum]GAP44826.1 Sec-independent protein translocase protein TatA [Lentimicrobium saccharophilum]
MYIQPLLFLDISGGEFLIIILAVFLIFGPKRMPEIARKIGRTMNELKKASSDITREFREETSGIARELNTARETLRHGSDIIRDELVNTGNKIEKEITPAGKEDVTPEPGPVPDPYGLESENNEPDHLNPAEMHKNPDKTDQKDTESLIK